MGLAFSERFLDVGRFVLLALALAAAIFLWGRGIRKSCKSDLIAGPAIFAATCLILLATVSSSAVFGLIGILVMVFGLASVLLGFWSPADGMLKKGDIQAIGAGMIILGACLSLIM